MYKYILIAVIVLIVLLLICLFIRLRAAHKVRCLSHYQKLCLLSEVCEPLGFRYDDEEEIFTSIPDAWQKDFGYGSFYDKMAPLFNMVFDCEPIYFDYRGHTWLIEFWKGQYGINVGAEIGVYRADGIVPPYRRKDTLFFGVPVEEAPKISYRLIDEGEPLFCVAQKSWWVTGFSMGRFTRRDFLHMPICLTFPNESMLRAFLDGMLEAGYERYELSVCPPCVSFCFQRSKSPCPCTASCRLVSRVQRKNARNVRLFLWFTRPFTNTLDRLVFLRFCFPCIFRRIVGMKCWRSCHFPKKKKHRCGC